MCIAKIFLTAGLAALLFTMGCAERQLVNNPSTATIDIAKTPADHEAIAKTYEDEAARVSKEADTHQELARIYKGTTRGAYATMSGHCAALAKEYRAAAKENIELAALQHQLAKEAAQ
jgi:hypothetical protein